MVRTGQIGVTGRLLPAGRLLLALGVNVQHFSYGDSFAMDFKYCNSLQGPKRSPLQYTCIKHHSFKESFTARGARRDWVGRSPLELTGDRSFMLKASCHRG